MSGICLFKVSIDTEAEGCVGREIPIVWQKKQRLSKSKNKLQFSFFSVSTTENIVFRTSAACSIVFTLALVNVSHITELRGDLYIM